MGAYGYADGCKRPYVHRSNAKKHNKDTEWSVWGYFCMHGKGKKITKSARMTAVSREHKWGGSFGEVRGTEVSYIVIAKKILHMFTE